MCFAEFFGFLCVLLLLFEITDCVWILVPGIVVENCVFFNLYVECRYMFLDWLHQMLVVYVSV